MHSLGYRLPRIHLLGSRLNEPPRGEARGRLAFTECRHPRARWKVEAADKEGL
jgi:hypothetical protein